MKVTLRRQQWRNEGDVHQREHHHKRSADDRQILPANKKRRTRVERSKTRPAFDLVKKAKSIWASFRSKRLDHDERQKHAQDLHDIIKGRLHQLAVKHDAARVVQCALKHGSPEHIEVYTSELLEHIMEFSKLQYAHFIILRLLDVTKGIPTARKKILHAFSGKALILATHAVGAKVLEGVFSSYPKQDTEPLRAELYGREVQLLALSFNQSRTRDLRAVLRELPERREAILDHVASLIGKMQQKGLTEVPFVQELIWEYVQEADPLRIRAIIPPLIDFLLLLTGTRPGCKALATCAGYGSAKDRKRMVKTIKGYVLPTLLHKDAYLIILRLADVMDDTVYFQKVVWTELFQINQTEDSLYRIMTHTKASKLLLHLLAPRKSSSFLTKDELELLKPTLVPASVINAMNLQEGEASKIAEEPERARGANSATQVKTRDKSKGLGGEETDMQVACDEAETAGGRDTDMQVGRKGSTKDGIESSGLDGGKELLPTSKKDAETRREELLRGLQEGLLMVCRQRTADLLVSQEGSFVLFECLIKWRDTEALAAVADICCADSRGDMLPDTEESEQVRDSHSNLRSAQILAQQQKISDGMVSGQSLREHPVAYRAIKRLILWEGEKDRDVTLARLLQEKIGRGKEGWLAWLRNMRGAFLIEALCKVPGVRQEIIRELEAVRDPMLELANHGVKGVQAILLTMQNKGEQDLDDSTWSKRMRKEASGSTTTRDR